MDGLRLTSDSEQPIWVKICGLTRASDVSDAVTAGADAIGFVFAPESPRRITYAAARELAEIVHQGGGGGRRRPAAIGVFRGLEPDEIAEAVTRVGLDGIQVYGEADELDRARDALSLREEAPETNPGETFVCWGVTQAPTRDLATTIAEMADQSRPDALLLDGSDPGSGIARDWRGFDSALFPVPVVIAGGLSPANVSEAVRATRPWGVDVSSGVESAPGIKDAAMIRAFIDAARRP